MTRGGFFKKLGRKVKKTLKRIHIIPRKTKHSHHTVVPQPALNDFLSQTAIEIDEKSGQLEFNQLEKHGIQEHDLVHKFPSIMDKTAQFLSKRASITSQYFWLSSKLSQGVYGLLFLRKEGTVVQYQFFEARISLKEYGTWKKHCTTKKYVLGSSKGGCGAPYIVPASLPESDINTIKEKLIASIKNHGKFTEFSRKNTNRVGL
jgi:hypothetical protein